MVNGWMVATIILIVLILGLVVVLDLDFKGKKDMEIEGLEIDYESFGILNNAMPEGPYALCSISQNKCVKLIKQSLIDK
jgi:hypothetical protein